MDYLLGIDLGTSSLRAILIDHDGRILGLAGEEYPIKSLQPSWAEQDPEAWWQATGRTVAKVLAKTGIDPRQIKGIGLSGQMHGTVVVDENGLPLRPAIIWPDSRSVEECVELQKRIGVGRLYGLTGLPTATGFMAPSVLWLMRHEPGVMKRAAKLLLPKDYVRFKLTGAMATDYTDATGTLFLDITARRWSEEVIAAAGIDASLLPTILESSALAGEVTDRAARETGLAAGTPVIVGGGDQAMGAIGCGVIADGIAASTIGTGGQLNVCVSRPVLDPQRRIHTLCHAVPGKWILMGAVLSAGLSLRWFRDNFGQLEISTAASIGVDPYEILSREAAEVPDGADGLIFLPYLSGDRTPHMDPYARGALIGLTLNHGRGHVVRAIMEGVSYAMRESLEIFKELGVSVERMLCSGGGARSSVWRQIQADMYEMPITVVDKEEHSSYGCALLAGVGVGIYPDIETACRNRVSFTSTTEPRTGAGRAPDTAGYYRSMFEVYRSLYIRLHEIFPVLGEKRAGHGQA